MTKYTNRQTSRKEARDKRIASAKAMRERVAEVVKEIDQEEAQLLYKASQAKKVEQLIEYFEKADLDLTQRYDFNKLKKEPNYYQLMAFKRQVKKDALWDKKYKITRPLKPWQEKIVKELKEKHGNDWTSKLEY